jgi:hypothetical protein
MVLAVWARAGAATNGKAAPVHTVCSEWRAACVGPRIEPGDQRVPEMPSRFRSPLHALQRRATGVTTKAMILVPSAAVRLCVCWGGRGSNSTGRVAYGWRV